MAKNINILIRGIEQMNIEDTYKKEIISQLKKGHLEKALKTLYYIIGIGKHIKDIFDI